MSKCVEINNILKKGVIQIEQPVSKVHIDHCTPPKVIEIVSTSGGTVIVNVFPYTGSAEISGSLIVEGPISASSFSGDGSGLTNLDPFPYTGSAIITGSLTVTGSNEFITEEGGYDFFLIKSGSITNLKFNNEGIAQFHAYENEFNPSPILGGLYFTSESLYIGLEK
jgi:hypothetical protein